jgi:diguanylate cyclase
MTDALMTTRFDGAVVLLSILLATAASYVGLDLAQRVRTAERGAALAWSVGGGLALGTGVWAMHFIGLLAFQLPVMVGYDPGPTALSWAAAVLVSGLALGLAGRRQPSAWVLAVAAVVMAAGICTMHYIGMAALRFAPAVVWQPGWVLLSAAVAVAASALALGLFSRPPAWAAGRPRRSQLAAAAVLAAGITAMHHAGMAAVSIPAGAVCLSAEQLRGDGLALLVAGAALLLLAVAFFASLIDARQQARMQALDASLQAAHDELQRAVQFDTLTCLPNRRLLFERLKQVGERCDAEGRQAALLFIDLDGFKPLNDLFGHGFGDAVLCEVAHRLVSVARGADTVARLGGDEFVILLADIDGPEVAHRVAMRVVAAVQAPLRLARRDARLSASVGVALYSQERSPTRLLAAADAAMHDAKRRGGGQVVFFSTHMAEDAREQMELQRDLRLAIEQPERGELSLHYQPKVDARDGRVTGVEALLRWHHPERGWVGPAVFIPVAERFGLIDRLGAWVIDQACAQVRLWQQQGLRLRVAVNLSMHQLRQAGLVDRVRAALLRHGLTPSRLMFEITESTAMEDGDATGRVFDELAALGTSLSIDDFGTGYSSLAYLRRLPSRQLKIDRSFVMDLDTCSDAVAIVEAVIRLAHALGLSVVAEGVETASQRDLLCQLQCDELQGYLFSCAVPGDTVMRWALDVDRPELLHFDPSTRVDPMTTPAPAAPAAAPAPAGAASTITA